MINLLPYEQRMSLKSLYKRRLLVVGFISIAISVLPLVFVLGVFAYTKYNEANLLNNQYNELEANALDGEAGSMVSQIRITNSIIASFEKDLESVKTPSLDIEKIISIKPADVKINKFNIQKKEDKTELVISGISDTRDSIINFGNTLDKKNGGICKSANVPVTTYSKKINVPFNITCEI